MRNARAFLLMLTFVIVVQGPVIAGDKEGARTYAPRGEPVRLILEILDRASLSASFEFSGACPGHNPNFPPLGIVRLGHDPIRDLHKVLADHPNIQIQQDSSGIVRMVERGIPKDILNVRIGHVSFDREGNNGKYGTYSPSSATATILSAPEVVAFMKSKHIEPSHGAGVPGNLVGERPTNQPHLSGTLENVTVSQALDSILATFPGMWVYQNCPARGGRGRDVFFGFFRLQRAGSNVLVVE